MTSKTMRCFDSISIKMKAYGQVTVSHYFGKESGQTGFFSALYRSYSLKHDEI